jgi:rhodanese-related sulfurtransferase
MNRFRLRWRVFGQDHPDPTGETEMTTFTRIITVLAVLASPLALAQYPQSAAQSKGHWQEAPQQVRWQQDPRQYPQQGQWQQNPQSGTWQQQPQHPQQPGGWQPPRQAPQPGHWQQPSPQQRPHGQWQQQPGPGGGPAQQGNPLQQLMSMERQDMGVPPQSSLKNGNMGGPTPASIPGGRVITTPEVLQALNNPQAGVIVLDVLGAQQRLPNAVNVVDASAGGSFDDRTQSQFENQLRQLTNGRKDVPMILYCSSINCWMSYNAALRAIHAGYTSVYWYRGGLEAWNTMAQMSMQYGNARPQGANW